MTPTVWLLIAALAVPLSALLANAYTPHVVEYVGPVIWYFVEPAAPAAWYGIAFGMVAYIVPGWLKW